MKNSALSGLGHAGDLGAAALYAEPAYYDQAYRKRSHDTAYYFALAQRLGLVSEEASSGEAGLRGRGALANNSAKILEYGVGSGRIALPLARGGATVYGVDLSLGMLNQLKARLGKEPGPVQKRVKIFHADMRKWRSKQQFQLIIAGFNTVLHLYTRQDVEAFFSRVKSMLAPSGRFVFDFSLPQVSELALSPKRSYSGGKLKDPLSGKLVKYSERFEYDAIRQVQLCWMQFDPVDGSPGWQVPLTHRQFFPQEMEALLHYAGFEDIRLSADFEARPLDSATDWVVADCGLVKPVKRRSAHG